MNVFNVCLLPWYVVLRGNRIWSEELDWVMHVYPCVCLLKSAASVRAIFGLETHSGPVQPASGAIKVMSHGSLALRHKDYQNKDLGEESDQTVDARCVVHTLLGLC
jgi:hypothetical protein